MNKNIFSEFRLSFSSIIFFLILIMLVIIPLTLGLETDSSENKSVKVTEFEWIGKGDIERSEWTRDINIIYYQTGKDIKKYLPHMNLYYINPDASEQIYTKHYHNVTWYYRLNTEKNDESIVQEEMPEAEEQEPIDEKTETEDLNEVEDIPKQNPDENDEASPSIELNELKDDTILEEGKYDFIAKPSDGYTIGTNFANEIDLDRLNYESLSEKSRTLTISIEKPRGKIEKWGWRDLGGSIVLDNEGSKIKSKLPKLDISYINPDASEKELNNHWHDAIWYYRHTPNEGEEPEKLQELTDDTELEDGLYTFVAVPGQGETIGSDPQNEISDFRRLNYDDISESDRSITMYLSGTNKWQWRYTYDYINSLCLTWDFGAYPEELKTIYTTSPDGASGSNVLASLPALTVEYTNLENGGTGPLNHWHNAKWYYYESDKTLDDKKEVQETDRFEAGKEYYFVVELAEGFMASNDMQNYGRLSPYPEIANIENRTLKIKIEEIPINKVEISAVNLVDSNQIVRDKDFYLKNEQKIYSEKEVSGNSYLFDNSYIKKFLPNFSLEYINVENVFNYKLNEYSTHTHIHKAKWQYRKEGEPISANKPFNDENLELVCDENNYCGKYVFTAEKIVEPIDGQNGIDGLEKLESQYLDEIMTLSITLTFMKGKTSEGWLVESANESYDMVVNMFDYWVSEYGPNAPDNFDPENYRNLGINNGHLLLFRIGNENSTLLNDGSAHFNLVQRTLDDNGYPVLNPYGIGIRDPELAKGNPSESLAYLFDPTMELETGKAIYTNVKGLFQKDEKGYYYYNYQENSASLQRDENGNIPPDGAKINLYDRPTIDSSGSPPGEFYPFNDIYDFFNEDGTMQNFTAEEPRINHYFGLTLEVPFRQPIDGIIKTIDGNEENMKFEFSGDDDVWVFIDGVLVLDLGGMHTPLSGSIDFRTGDVNYEDKTQNTTLRDLFELAGKSNVMMKNKTFADNTTHTLKMFYMERANHDSTMNIKFNLQPLSSNKIKKIDFDNNPIEGVVFNLYESDENRNEGELVTTLVTNEQGEVTFKDESGEKINFFERGKDYYLLKEIEGANGYRANSQAILIKYDGVSKSLKAVDKYTSGVTTTFDYNLLGQSDIKYKKLEGNELTEDDNSTPAKSIKDNLVLAVPLTKHGDKWVGLYSNNIDGYSCIENDDFKKTIIMAALYQIYYNPSSSWKITWDDSKKGIDTLMNDLPGSADRYIEHDDKGDMRLEYIMLSEFLLDYLNLDEISTENFNKVIKDEIEKNNAIINDESVNNAISFIAERIIGYANLNPKINTLDFVNFSHYDRTYNSTIIIPNRQRELRVQKVDTSEDSNPIEGAKFSIFTSIDDAELETNALSTGTTDSNGMLSFKVSGTNNVGSAKMAWPSTGTTDKYYLKEISTQNGYVINETIIPITIGDYAIYADAKEEDDGVSVIADVGKLAYNLRQYASNSNFNITLRDIEAIFQTGTNLEDFEDFSSQLLSYTENNNGYYETIGKIRVIEKDGQIEVDTGLARVILKQCHNKENCPYDEEKFVKDELSEDEELNSIFGMINTVKVANQKQNRKISGIAFENLNENDEYDEEDILLENINVSLIHNGTTVATKKTNENGYYEFNNLQYSEYSIKFEISELSTVLDKGETENSNKADKNGLIESIKFEKTTGEFQNIEHMNLGLRSANLIFTKIEVNDESKPISNDGLFELYEYVCDISNKAYTDKLVSESPNCFKQYGHAISTDEEGKIIFPALKQTTYRLVEKEAPKGFVRPSGEWNVKIEKNIEGKISTIIECVGGDGRTCPAFKTGENGELYLPNMKVVSMPNSGGFGVILMTMFGVSIMGFGITYMFSPNKEDYEKSQKIKEYRKKKKYKKM